MSDLLSATWLFGLTLANHIFGMMYWMWIPGFALSGLFFVRYHRPLRIRLAETRRVTPSSLWLALLAGATGSSARRTVQRDLKAILSRGVSSPVALTYVISGLNLVPYALSFLTLNLGLEFFLGQVIGAGAMAALTALFLSFFLKGAALGTQEKANPAKAQTIRVGRQKVPSSPSLAKGIFRYFGGEWRGMWLSALLGLLLAGVIGALGQREWWPDFYRFMGNGFLAEVGNAFLGALLGVLFFAAPPGHLFLATMLWKAYTLTFGGIVAFILASAASPYLIRLYRELLGPRMGCCVALLLYLSASLGALVPVGLFWLIGFEVTHVPRFHEWVNPIMMFFALWSFM